MIIYILLFLILIMISLFSGYLIYNRVHDGEKYYVLNIRPLKYDGSRAFIQKMAFFLQNCKSIPSLHGKHNIILDITNKGTTTDFRIIVPELYLEDYTHIFKSNYDNFEIEMVELISEKEFFNQYEGAVVFRTNSDTPFLKEEIHDEKIGENIKSIVSGVKDGSFQIILNFDSKSESFATTDEIQDVKIDNTMATSNINFVKDISVSFRFLSFKNDYVSTVMPGLVGGILNLGGKLNNITKTYSNGKLRRKSLSKRKWLRDNFYTLIHTSSLRFEHFSPADGMLFNAKEISYIYNFIPSDKTTIQPNKKYSPIEAIKYQDNLVEKSGNSSFTNVAFYDYPGLEVEKRFMLHEKTLRRHTYIIGKTGTGKTTALKVFMKDDIEKGRGFAVLDPNGDVTREVLDFIPKEREEDVIYIDPSIFLGRVCCGVFSFLRELRHYQKEYEIDEHSKASAFDSDSNFYHMEYEDKFMAMVVAMIKAVSVGGNNMWGPRMDKIMKEVGTTTLKYDISEISDISQFLNNPKYRAQFIKAIENEDIRDSLLAFEYKPMKEREEAFQPVRNRFDVFLSDTMKNIFSGKPKFSLREAMDSGKIIVFRLPKGSIGNDNASLLGGMVVSLFWAMAQTRISIPEEERKDYTLYIDEFQNFVNESFSQILEEARKYRLRLVLANQYTKQIKHKNEAVFDSIKGNIGTFIALGIGSDDSQVLSKHFGIDAFDMGNIPPHKGYVKCEEYSSTPFSVKMELVEPDKNKEYSGADFIKHLSYKKYGIDSEKTLKTEEVVVSKERLLRSLKLFPKDVSIINLSASLKIDRRVSEKLLGYLLEEGYVQSIGDTYQVIEQEIEVKYDDFVEVSYDCDHFKEKSFLSLSSYFRENQRLPNYSYSLDNYLRDLRDGKKTKNNFQKKFRDESIIDKNLINNEVDIDQLFSEIDNEYCATDLLDYRKFEVVDEPGYTTYIYKIPVADKGKKWEALSDELGFESLDMLRLNNTNNSLGIAEKGTIKTDLVGQRIVIRLKKDLL